MTKSKRNIIIVSVVVFLLLVGYLVFFVFGSFSFVEKNKLTSKWQIDFPQDSKMVYKKGTTFIDGSCRLFVFSANEFAQPSTSTKLTKEQFEQVFENAIGSIKEVDSNHLPDFAHHYTYAFVDGGASSGGLRREYLYTMFVEEDNLLFVIEDTRQNPHSFEKKY